MNEREDLPFESFPDEGPLCGVEGFDDNVTQSIDLCGLLDPDFSESGTFDLGLVRSSAFGKILDAIPIPALLIDSVYYVRYANEACLKLGQRVANVVHQPFVELVPKSKNAERARLLLERAFATRQPIVAEAVLDIDKHKIWGRIHLRSVRMGHERQVLLLIEDLTLERTQLALKRRHEQEIQKAWEELEQLVQERTRELARTNQQLRGEIEEHRKTQEKLAFQSRRFHLLAEYSPLGMVMVDRNDAIQYVNPTFRNTFGYNSQDCASGAELFKAIHLDLDLEYASVAEWSEMVQAAAATAGWPRQTSILCRDGIEKHVEVLAVALGNGDHLVTWEDVTTQRKAQEVLLKTERLNALAEMATGVAHNFNNLLQMVTGSAEQVLVSLDSADTFETKINLNHILKEARLGMHTVKRLQTFAGERYHDETGAWDAVDLSETAAQAIDMTSPWWKIAAEKAGMCITFLRKLQPKCTVRGNRGELFEMAVNLIKNASEALPHGGVIEVETSVSDDTVVLSVKDNGVGISEDNLTKVFEPFWTTKGERGTGIGLSSAFGIARAHDGGILVESQEGEGSTFIVRLPYCRDLPDAAKQPEFPTLDKTLSILVVDDIQSIVGLLESGLGRLGHKVYAAFSGTEALEAFEREKIDLVICDLGMPHMNGWQVAEAIQDICAQRGEAKVPFVLMTGWGRSQDDTSEVVQTSAVDRVINKPVSLAQLMSAISDLEFA